MALDGGFRDGGRTRLPRRLSRILSVAAVVAAAGLGWILFEPYPPTVSLETPLTHLGQKGDLRLRIADTGSGLGAVEVAIEAAGKRYLLVSEAYPKVGWRGSGIHDRSFHLQFDTNEAGIPDGKATLSVLARDHSWLNYLRSRPPLLAEEIVVDTQPPRLELLTGQHYLRLGGSDLGVFRISEDAIASGIEITRDFPAVLGLLRDPQVAVSLYAVPYDLEPNRKPRAFAADRAGNRREAELSASIKGVPFRKRILEIDAEFLASKIPDLLRENGMRVPDDPVEAYLVVNRDLRAASEKRIREVCASSIPTPLWDGPFLRQPGSATLSRFADHRTYVHDGRAIDHQVHLGVDLASLRRSPVVAANRGMVAFAATLGIYGETVLLDHGLGLFSLYGHLSTIQVEEGQEVAKGDPIGRTGETGLAGGDHLHFSMLVHGVHVDPVEWWDPHWIDTHVNDRIAELGGFKEAS